MEEGSSSGERDCIGNLFSYTRNRIYVSSASQPQCRRNSSSTVKRSDLCIKPSHSPTTGDILQNSYARDVTYVVAQIIANVRELFTNYKYIIK